MVSNAAKHGITQEMQRLWKQNGLIWTLLSTSNIPNILLYSFDSTYYN